MKTASPEDLGRAFDAALSSKDSDGGRLADLVSRQAFRILRTGRALHRAEPCPPEVLQGVRRLFAIPPRGLVRTVLDLVFDSGHDLAPAVRGAWAPPRTLRYAGGGATVDMQVRKGENGRKVLHVAVTPPRRGVTIELHVLPRSRALRVRLDDQATGDLALPARATHASAAVRFEGSRTFWIGDVPID